MNQIKQGKVRWWSYSKGHGFIIPQGVDPDALPKQDIFVHHTGIAGSGHKNLDEGDRVEYQVKQNGDKGLLAYNVEVIR